MNSINKPTCSLKASTAVAAILLAFVQISCDGITRNPVSSIDSRTDVPEASQYSQHAHHAERPVSGNCETTFDPATFLRPPAVFSQTDTGSCRMTHLGLTDFFSLKEIDFAAGTQKTTEAYFTAANGDILYATGEGFSSPGQPGTIHFNSVLTFSGGTGRFSSATGSVHVEGTADVINRMATFRLYDGVISYNASDRNK
jgi:hypothetical protein